MSAQMKGARVKGALVLAGLLAGACAAQAAGDARRGEKVFEECRACHAVERGVDGQVGPALHGLFGRRAGTAGDFRFSPAMKRSNINWNAQTLDAYIADPQVVVPANRMPYAGLPGAGDRADLIEYMREVFR